MKKTVQIHIGGRQFHINEDAFSKISSYVDTLKAHFKSEGASGKEIIEDIESRIAELFEDKISESKQAITLVDVEEIIATLGKIEDFEYAEKGTADAEDDQPYYERRQNRRLFRDPDHYYFGGVASGLGAYFDIDPLWIRLIFLALFFVKGLGLLIYIILWIAVPKARNTAEKLQMKGMPVNLSNIKESVNAEYQKVKSSLSDLSKSPGVSKFGDVVENIARAFALVFVAILKFIIAVIGIAFIVAGSIVLIALILMIFGQVNLFTDFHIWNGLNFPDMGRLFTGLTQYNALIISLLVVILIPIVVLIYQGIKIIFNIRTRHHVLRAFTLTTWVLALILFVTLIIINSTNFAVEASGTEQAIINNKTNPILYVDVRDNSANKRVTNYWLFGHNFRYNNSDETLYKEPGLYIRRSENSDISLVLDKRARNVGAKNAQDHLERIYYNWEQIDSVLYLDRYFYTDDEDFWMFPQMDIDLNIPDDQVIVLSKSVRNIWKRSFQNQSVFDSISSGWPAVMTPEGMILMKN